MISTQVDAYLFAQKDAPQHWPGALLAGVYEDEPEDDDVEGPDDDAAGAVLTCAEIKFREAHAIDAML